MHVPKTRSRFFDAFHQEHGLSRRHIETNPMIVIFDAHVSEATLNA
jgi:hypothetical protein